MSVSKRLLTGILVFCPFLCKIYSTIQTGKMRQLRIDISFCFPRPRNVEAAIKVGMTGLKFQNAQKLENDLLTLGLLL